MRVLVTGGAGFIGSHIVEHFQGRAEVRVLDNLRSGSRENLRGFAVDFVEGSVLDEAVVQRAMAGVDVVFHLAALVSVGESMEKPVECEQVNVIGLLHVLRAAAQAKVRKLCFSSSCAVYGDSPVVPKHEDMMPAPASPYAVSKLAGEHYCDLFTRHYALPTVALRYFNVFGPRQDPASAYAAAIPIFISKALRNETIQVFGDGEQTRDFIYVKDVVAANVHLALQSPKTGVFNVAYGSRLTVNDLAMLILRLTGSSAAVEHVAVRAGDVRYSQAAVDRLLATGLRRANNFGEGLSKTIAFFRNPKTGAA